MRAGTSASRRWRMSPASCRACCACCSSMHGRATPREVHTMSDRKSHLDTLAVLSLVACSFLWGLNHVAAKMALAEIPPLLQATARSFGGVALVLLWARVRGIPLFQRD